MNDKIVSTLEIKKLILHSCANPAHNRTVILAGKLTLPFLPSAICKPLIKPIDAFSSNQASAKPKFLAQLSSTPRNRAAWCPRTLSPLPFPFFSAVFLQVSQLESKLILLRCPSVAEHHQICSCHVDRLDFPLRELDTVVVLPSEASLVLPLDASFIFPLDASFVLLFYASFILPLYASFFILPL